MLKLLFLSIAAIILLFGSTIYFAFIANPNRLFKNQTTDISSLKLILCSPFSGACQIHKEYEDPKEIRKILSMFEINWWNSIFRNLSGVAGKPIIELSTPDKTIILEFSPYNITFFDQIGEFTLTDSSRIKITDFLTGLSK